MANQVKTRLGKLEPQSERLWGKMTAAQMLAHCSVSLQWAVGELVPEKGSASHTSDGATGQKPMVFRNEDPLRKNSPTQAERASLWPTSRDLNKERETGYQGPD